MAGGGGGEEGDFGFQIAPMVDVVFVLLLFFMACAGQKTNEGFIQIALPSQQPGKDEKIIIPLVVDIDAVGNVTANGQQMSGGTKDRELKLLQEHLISALQSSKDNPVIIRPSPEARHERVIDVLNVCRIAKVEKLSFG